MNWIDSSEGAFLNKCIQLVTVLEVEIAKASHTDRAERCMAEFKGVLKARKTELSQIFSRKDDYSEELSAGAFLKLIREKILLSSLTEREIAATAGCSQGTINKIKNGKFNAGIVYMLFSIAKTLNLQLKLIEGPIKSSNKCQTPKVLVLSTSDHNAKIDLLDLDSI